MKNDRSEEIKQTGKINYMRIYITPSFGEDLLVIRALKAVQRFSAAALLGRKD